MFKDSPDKYYPTGSTCFFTLKLPKYSSKKILEEKLKYVINNCNEIDTDYSKYQNSNVYGD